MESSAVQIKQGSEKNGKGKKRSRATSSSASDYDTDYSTSVDSRASKRQRPELSTSDGSSSNAKSAMASDGTQDWSSTNRDSSDELSTNTDSSNELSINTDFSDDSKTTSVNTAATSVPSNEPLEPLPKWRVTRIGRRKLLCVRRRIWGFRTADGRMRIRVALRKPQKSQPQRRTLCGCGQH
jgi:hypothetical protein